MAAGNDRHDDDLTRSHSRRATLRIGGALLTAMGAFSHVRSAAAQATPTGENGELLLAQGFSQGNLFPTQGDVGVLPYTLVVWDAADRGFFFTDAASGTAGVVPTDSVIAAIGAEGVQPYAVVVASGAAAGDAAAMRREVWALRLGYGSLGSDPGAVTYQGEPLPAADLAALVETAPAALPDGPRDLGAGFVIIAGLSGVDASVADAVTLHPR